MAKQVIGIGTVANDGTGDTLRVSMDKVNDNFTEVYDDKDFLLEQTGWASYADNSYTSGSPLELTSGATSSFINRAKTIVDSQIPTDIKTFYCPVELTVASIVGTFVEGEVITGGTSGATGDLKEIASALYRITNLTGTFVNAETITGGTSGATATVSSNKTALIMGREGDSLDLMIYFKALPASMNSELEIWIDIGGAVGELYRQTFYFRGATEKGVMYVIPSGYTLNTWEANGGKVFIKAIGSDFDVYNLNFNFDRSHKSR